MNEIYWGGRLSNEGQIQVLQEQLAAERDRANRAEANLRRVREILGACLPPIVVDAIFAEVGL